MSRLIRLPGAAALLLGLLLLAACTDSSASPTRPPARPSSGAAGAPTTPAAPSAPAATTTAPGGATAQSQPTTIPLPAKKINVVATTTQIADFARVVGGEYINLAGIMQPNVDPHTFDPTADDAKKFADADVVLMHGLKFDRWTRDLLKNQKPGALVVTVTDNVSKLPALDDGHGHTGDDPHVWTAVPNAVRMVESVRDALVQADPNLATAYQANAARYLTELDALDKWIGAQIETIPADQRKLVTNHEVFNYYCDRYKIQFVGAIIPSIGSEAEPSAREIADTVRKIRDQKVKAVFAEASINPKLAQQIAQQAGVKVVATLYGDSLGPAGSDGATYIDMMRSNTQKIVDALK